MIFALLLLPPLSHAGTPPGFDAAKWNQLISQAMQTGNISHGGDEEYHTLVSLQPNNPAQPHQADYFNAVGAATPGRPFAPLHISVVSETWTKTMEGNWNVDQWDWDLGDEGNLRGLSHTIISESAAGTILGVTPSTTGGPDDPGELARWGAKLSYWLARAAQ